MAHPADWTVEFDLEYGEDVFTGAEGEEVRVSRYEHEEGWAADIIFASAAQEFEERYGVSPVLVEQLALADGTRIQVYQYHEPTGGGLLVTQRAVVLAVPDVWFVDWESEADQPGPPREQLVRMVKSFTPGPLLPDNRPA